MSFRLILPMFLIIASSGLFAVPLTLEYNVSGTGPPYTYSFRLVLDNHDGSWGGGQGWSKIIFGQAVPSAVNKAPFANWQTDSSSYPVGPFTSTYWSSFTTGGLNYVSPVLVNPSGGASDFWYPTLNEELVWWGINDLFLNDGEMTWATSHWVAGGASYVDFEPAKRVGDYLRVEPVAAAAVDVRALETGSGDGFMMGSFKVISHSVPAVMTIVYVSADGTGDDSSAFSEIGLFVDVNGNGAYDPGVDRRFGQAYPAYPADNGALTFTDVANPVTLAANSEVTMLVVAKLSGPVPAASGQTFNTVVNGIGATGYAHTGMPTAAIPGCKIVPGPNIRVFRDLTVINNGLSDALGNVAGAWFDLTYTIHNTGLLALSLSGDPVVTPGTNVTAAWVLTSPSATVSGGLPTTFTIRCTPSGPGPFEFTVEVHSNSELNNPMSWTVTGNAVDPPPGNNKGSSSEGGGCSSRPGRGSALILVATGVAMLLRRRRIRCRP